MDKVIFLVVGVIWGFVIGIYPKENPKTITTVVNQPATDDQLLEFWFGNGDKDALRKRICK